MHGLKFSIPALVIALLSATPALAGDVTITLKGVMAQKGDLLIGMQRQDEFMQDKGSYGEIVKSPTAGDRVIVLKNVTAGDYSISAWHDGNGDRVFNRAPNGAPLDGWAMVNGDKLRAVPTWDQVKFTVPEGGAALALTMVYAK
jgi:uncharacterized protein (DUF2141 family)